jgi:hypothetical protein
VAFEGGSVTVQQSQRLQYLPELGQLDGATTSAPGLTLEVSRHKLQNFIFS